MKSELYYNIVANEGSSSLIIDIATVVIALMSVAVTIILFFRSRKDSNKTQKDEFYLSLIYNVVIERSLPFFYNIYDSLEKDLLTLKDIHCDKDKLECNIQNDFLLFRKKFYNILNVIDPLLYERIHDLMDEFIDSLVVLIGDSVTDFTDSKCFDQYIDTPCTDFKNKIIKLIVCNNYLEKKKKC